MHILGSLLQLRGQEPGVSPAVDGRGNVLAFSGEVFGGFPGLNVCESDTSALLSKFETIFETTTNTNAFIDLVSKIQGPWSLVYWHEASKKLWFGRDVFGRRSLLIHEATERDGRFILSSQASFVSENESENEDSAFWSEIQPGLYSVDLSAQRITIKNHAWRDVTTNCLRLYDRAPELVQPTVERTEGTTYSSSYNTVQDTAIDGFIAALSSAVEKRVTLSINNVRSDSLKSNDDVENSSEPPAFLGILFSGGVDSALLAAVAHKHVPPSAVIDLCTVCFAGGTSPDRLAALDGLRELKTVFPSRKWRLIEIEATMQDVDDVSVRLNQTLHPSNTVMDVNIGAALWFAAQGEGWIEKVTETGNGPSAQKVKYKSKAKVLLLGQGADEQCAGYKRHRATFLRSSLDSDETTTHTNNDTLPPNRNKNWQALNSELQQDMCRLWQRNLGRDDRLISDHSREGRFPFLDEGVVACVLSMNLSHVAHLENEGICQYGAFPGDKILIRAAAVRLGLHRCAARTKRAIQFGSRISKAYDLQEFGSSRKAKAMGGGTHKAKS